MYGRKLTSDSESPPSKTGVRTFTRGQTALWRTERRWMVELEAVCEPRSSKCSSGLAQTASVMHLVSSMHPNIV